jgi:hypothetical protein
MKLPDGYVHKYANKIFLSVYTERIIKGITVWFKKDKSFGDVIFLLKKWLIELLNE